MINLIRRDLIIQKWQLLFFIPFILVFALTDMPAILIIIVASIFIPFNTLYYDERAETNILLNSLPYTRKEIIASRFLGAIVYLCVSIMIVSLLLLLFQKSITLTDIMLSAGLFLCFVAISYPIYYMINHGNTTMFILIGFLGLNFIMAPIISYFINNQPAVINYILSMPRSYLYITGAVFVSFIYLLSWVVTTVIYERKEF